MPITEKLYNNAMHPTATVAAAHFASGDGCRYAKRRLSHE